MRTPTSPRRARRWRSIALLAITALIVPLDPVLAAPIAAGPAIAALDNGLTGPFELAFDPQVTGRTSPAKSLVITATGTEPTTISTIELSGGQAGDFAIASDTCTGAVLAPAETCAVGATFTPSTTGGPSTQLTIHADTVAGSISVSLHGFGLIAALTPSQVQLGSHVVGTSGSAVATLVNGIDAKSIDGFNLEWPAGSPGSNPFSIRPASGCTALTSLPALGTCEITIDFTPTVIMELAAPLGATIGGQQIEGVYVYGTGLAASGVAWGAPHFVRGGAWTTGSGLARTVKGSTAYLHAVYATDYLGKYANDTSPRTGMYYRRSTNGGTSWGSSVRLNPSTTQSVRGAIAAYGSRVYGVYVTQTKWIKYSNTAPRVLYFRSNANYGSGAWSTPKRLTSTTGRVDYPTIAAASANVYVAYTDGKTGNVRLAISHNRGSSFSTTTLGTTTNAMKDGKAGFPSVAAYGSLVIVAWTADTAGKIYVKVSKDAGRTWIRTTPTTSATGFAATAATSNRLSVAWTTNDGAAIRTWKPAGWGPVVTAAPPVIAGTYGGFDTAAIALTGTGQAGVAWAGYRSDASSSQATYDLVWSESTDGGATFAHPIVIVDGSAGGPVYRANFSPSVVWGSATQRYVMHAAEVIGETYTVQIRTGTGAP